MSAPGTVPTVVWDIGGVLLRWEPRVLLSEVLLPRHPGADVDVLRRAIFGSDAWHAFDSGRIGPEELAVRAAAAAGLEVEDLDLLLEAIYPHLVDLTPTWELVRRVRAAGHRVVYLSNMPHLITDRVGPRMTSLFEEGLFSCDAGEAKPSPAIFPLAERALALDPTRLLFFDDGVANVETARAAGWRAVLFTGAAEAEKVLVADGWL
ncbi:MAG: HAD family phosphatase [Nocardioidaceae bacterium]|nr:HAD family phosphatase [Nocardioidaceae bacterium]